MKRCCAVVVLTFLLCALDGATALATKPAECAKLRKSGERWNKRPKTPVPWYVGTSQWP